MKSKKLKGSASRSRQAPPTKPVHKALTEKEYSKLLKNFKKIMHEILQGWNAGCQCESCRTFRDKTLKLFKDNIDNKEKREVLIKTVKEQNLKIRGDK